MELEFRESMSHRAEKGYILPGQMDVLSGWEKVAAGIRKAPFMTLASIEMKKTLVKPEKTFSISAQSVTSYNNSFEMLVKDLKQYKEEKYRVLLLSSSRTRAERLAADLREEGLSAVFTGNPEREVQEGEILTCYGHAGKGFAYPLLKFVVISESDIFGNGQKKKKRKPKYEGQKIKDFSELKVGDYVVHESHGLGIYRGIEKVEVDKVVKDYLKIEYRDGGNLYILATGLDVIQKYASADAKTPKLNKLGTQEWDENQNEGAHRCGNGGKGSGGALRQKAAVRRAISTGRIPSGSGNLRKCSPMRKRRTSLPPLRTPRQTWRAEKSWTA